MTRLEKLIEQRNEFEYGLKMLQKLGINIETVSAYKNFKEMLNSGQPSAGHPLTHLITAQSKLESLNKNNGKK